jgi:hypothetical protein
MKKLMVLFLVVGLVAWCAGIAGATPKASGAVYSRTGDTVTIKGLDLSHIKAIEIYDDCKGTEKKVLAPALHFNLVGCQGFNIIWADKSGTWFDLITPTSKAQGLFSLPDNNGDNCKWVRSDSPQLQKK